MMAWHCFFVSFAMGKKTKLHEAAERGESEELQRLLDSGSYDVNEGSDESWHEEVCGERESERRRERKREREVLTYSFFLLIFTLRIVCDE
jgi:hypothetical protein